MSTPYTIFVPVSEFMDHGGKLKPGRNIYRSPDKDALCGQFVAHTKDVVGSFIQVHCGMMTSPWNTFTSYVEIECTPIWK